LRCRCRRCASPRRRRPSRCRTATGSRSSRSPSRRLDRARDVEEVDPQRPGTMGAELAILDGKVALVTGGGRGIGRATAIAFAEGGASVGLCDIDRLAGAAAVTAIEAIGGRARFMAADVSVPAEAQAFVNGIAAAFGRVDILVNNAGTTHDPTSFESF